MTLFFAINTDGNQNRGGFAMMTLLLVFVGGLVVGTMFGDNIKKMLKLK